MDEMQRVSEAYRALMDCLTQLLRKHFEHLSPEVDFDYEAYWIHHSIFSEEHALHHSGVSDVQALNKIEAALDQIKLGDVSPAANEMLFGRVVKEIHRGSTSKSEYIRKFRTDSVLEALIDPEFWARLRKHVSGLKGEIVASTTGKEKETNFLGIQAIDDCRVQWARLTGCRPPRSGFSAGSDFEDYLMEIWEIFNLPGNPRTAFNAWYREFLKHNNDRTEQFFS